MLNKAFYEIDVSNMDRDSALVLYNGKLYEDSNHQYALECALNEWGSSMNIDLENDIDSAAELTHTLSKQADIATFDIFIDRNDVKYLISHFEHGLELNWDLMYAYAQEHYLQIGTFKDFSSNLCRVFTS